MAISKKISGWIFATTSLAFIVVAFQNCSGQTGGPEGVYTNSSTNSANNGTNNSSNANSANYPPTSSGVTTVFKAFGATNTQAQIDCSVAPAAMTGLRVEGADADLRICAEFVLDMPMGSPRYGERNLCDNASKFGPPDDEWAYNSDLKIWYTIKDSQLPNHPAWVPGTYYLVAMNRNGTIVKSQPMVIKRPNSTNCWSSSVASPTTGPVSPSSGMTCAWSGGNIVAGPVAGPSQSCSLSNRGATATVEGRNYTCVCR